MLRMPAPARATLLALLLYCPADALRAQPKSADYEQIQNLVSQKADLENRIANLQDRIDEASAQSVYCTAQERQEDLRNLRSLQREALALRQDYARFKAGFIALASSPGAGPHLDEANVHPDERRFWSADDNAVQKLRDSALSKADRVEDAKIADCGPKNAPPATSPPPTAPPPGTIRPSEKERESEQPRTPTVVPYAPPQTSRFPPPAAPLGGRLPGYYCTDQERIEELFRLQEQLIRTDESTREGHARGDQLRQEIKRAKEARLVPCEPPAARQPEPRERPLPQINLPLGEPPIENPRPPEHAPRDQSPFSFPGLRVGPFEVQPGQSLNSEQRERRRWVLVPPPTMPLGGPPPGTYCSEQQRIEELQRLQEQLISTDGSTPGGRVRQQQIEGEIQRAKSAKVLQCGSEQPR